ncbi:fibronectin type III domain-containing protein [Peribacillus simplex]
MEGLTPNTSYTYRVGSAAGWSEAYTSFYSRSKKVQLCRKIYCGRINQFK